jgi:hypothetical protein
MPTKDTPDLNVFIPKKKYHSIDKMTPIEWAELIIEFHDFCKVAIKRITGESYMPARPKKTEHLFCFQDTESYQAFPKNEISRSEELVTGIYNFYQTTGSGYTCWLFIDKHLDLYIGEASFEKQSILHRGKDSFFYVKNFDPVIATKENLYNSLEDFRSKKMKPLNSPGKIGQKILQELYAITTETVQKTLIVTAQSKSDEFKDNLAKEIIQKYIP